jgi:hypothetical protein
MDCSWRAYEVAKGAGADDALRVIGRPQRQRVSMHLIRWNPWGDCVSWRAHAFLEGLDECEQLAAFSDATPFALIELLEDAGLFELGDGVANGDV